MIYSHWNVIIVWRYTLWPRSMSSHSMGSRYMRSSALLISRSRLPRTMSSMTRNRRVPMNLRMSMAGNRSVSMRSFPLTTPLTIWRICPIRAIWRGFRSRRKARMTQTTRIMSMMSRTRRSVIRYWPMSPRGRPIVSFPRSGVKTADAWLTL